MHLGLLALLGIAVVVAAPSSDVTPDDHFDTVVIDPGHGGVDLGARGHGGALEKDLVLRGARRIGTGLEALGMRVVFTRTEDRFLTLAERTEVANRAGGDLYLSIHGNWAEDRDARGPETFFLSLEASDEEAQRVAMTENQVFGQEAAVADSDDIVGAILGDLILTDHLRASSQIAAAIQRNLAKLPGPDRGVKQAPFVVLMGVNMPAALVEIGFLTNAEEATQLRKRAYQGEIAEAVVLAVKGYRDAHNGTLTQEAAR
jgi:N-acetylmuramoyl-L-alanine amidase